MRVLFITQWWEPDEGPPHWRLRRFADSLISAGHDVVVIAPPPHYPDGSLTSTHPAHQPGAVDQREPGLTVLRTKYRKHTDSLTSRVADQLVVLASTLLTVASDLRGDRRPDVVVAAVPTIPSAFTGHLVSGCLGVPLVIDLRDAWPDLLDYIQSPDIATSSGSRHLIGPLIRIVFGGVTGTIGRAMNTSLRHADLVVTTSDWLRISLDRRGVSHSVTVRNTPVTPLTGNSRPSVPGLGPPQRELRVLYAGTVGRAQGLSNAIHAVSTAASAGADLILRVVGRGAELENLRTLADRLNAPIEFVDPLPHAATHEHYDWCDVVLVHLRDWEPLTRTVPSKLMETMARGLPVIAAVDGESAHIVETTGAGTAVDAMKPDILAKVLISYSRDGVPATDSDGVRAWLDTFADYDRTSSAFVHAVENIAAQVGHRRPSAFERTRSLVRLTGHAIDVGRDDPVHLCTLVSRRLPPNIRDRVTSITSSAAPSGALRGIALLVGDERMRAQEQFDSARPGPLRNLLGFHLRVPGGHATHRTLRARRAWEVGDVTGALDAVRPSSLSGRRWRGVVRTLDPEYDPGRGAMHGMPVSDSVRSELARLVERPGNLRVLHYLTNSVPHTQSGYTVRSHSVLVSQNAAGMVAAGVTRLGYPESIGIGSTHSVDVVDGVAYFRMNDHAIPTLPDARLQAATRQLLSIVNAFNPHVLHTTTNYENGLVVRAVSKLTGIPWVYETRGELEKTWLARQPEDAYAAAKNSEYYRLLRDAETALMRDADGVIALSRVQERSHVRRGVNPDSLRVVPNSVDVDFLDLPLTPSHDARAKVGLTESFSIGTVSSLVDYEGLDTMLRALSLLLADGLRVRAIIVGDGAARPDLQALTRELGLQEAVDLPGRVPFDDVATWYDAIDIFCVPRRDVDVTRSVTPLKPLQAMARRRPVIVSDLDALKEITSDRGAGTAVPSEDPRALADAVRSLATDRVLYEACATAARAAAESTRWDIAATTYRDMYTRVTGGGK